MNSNTISLIIIAICVAMSAYFSATETAFSALNHIRIKNMAEKGNSKAALVLKLSANYNNLLSTILIGNNIVNIAMTSLTTVLFVRWMGGDQGASVATLVTTVVVLIFGEVSPKSIAKESPEAVAMFSAPLLRILIFLLTPFNFLFAQWKKLLSKIIKSSEDRGITDEELLTIVEEAQQEGGIDEQESNLIRRAIEFMDLETVDIYTPRVDIVAIPSDATKQEIADLFLETGYSRLPVYDEDIDHIIGVVNQKDFHNYIFNTKQALNSIIRPVLFITPNMKIGTLLKNLQAGKSHIAIILDEFGGTEGLVTMEDIVEELVGEIWDEHDEVIQEIQPVSQDEYLVLGSTNVDKLFEKLGIEKEFEVITVSGWVMEYMECLPKENDSFISDGLEVTVLKMNDRRIEQVRVKKISPSSDNSNDTTAS